MQNDRQRVGVVFGGPSVEHDVSVITAQQAIAVLSARHDPIPLYVARDGAWHTGDALKDVAAFATDPPEGGEPVELRLGRRDAPFATPARGRFRSDEPVHVDVVLNAIHGTGGEDGALLGALELAQLPFVGGGVGPAAVAMDKAIAKAVFRDHGIDVLDHHAADRDEWDADRKAVADAIEARGFPCFVKPVSLGSSIGVSRCESRDELEDALELGFELDRRVIVEAAAEGAIEVNCAVLGRPGGEYRPSEVEQPIGGGAGLTFEDKYLRGGGAGKGGGAAKGAPAKGASGGGAKDGGGMAGQDRLIPAPIPGKLRERIRETATSAHRALRFAGVARYDFFVFGDDDDARIVLNEPNTVPGSFAFYLFEPIGLPFADLLDELLAIAHAEAREARATTRSFDSVLLQMHHGG